MKRQHFLLCVSLPFRFNQLPCDANQNLLDYISEEHSESIPPFYPPEFKASLIPSLSPPRACTKTGEKEGGESGIFYHVGDNIR